MLHFRPLKKIQHKEPIFKGLMFYFLFLLFPVFVFGQSLDRQIQNFEKLNSKATLSTAEINSLTEICNEMLTYDLDVALKYLQKVGASIDKNDQVDAIPNYASILSRAYYFKEQPDKGLELVRDLYTTYKDQLSPADRFQLLITIIVSLDGMEKNSECLPLVVQAFKESKQVPDSDNKTQYLATLYNVRGKSLKRVKSDHEAATADFLRALRLYKLDKRPESIQNVALIYNRLGLMYQDLKDYPKSVSYFLEGIREVEKVEKPMNLALLYSNLGTAYEKTDSLQKALHFEDKALKIALKNNMQVEVARINSNLGSIYLKMKNYPKALNYTKRSLEFCQTHGIAEGKMYNFVSLGDIYAASRQHKNALAAYDSAMVYAKELKMPRVESSLYQQYSNLYKETGDYKKALHYFNRFSDMEKEFFGQEKQKAIAELEIQYQTELKDKKIQNASAAIKAKNAQNRFLVIGIIAIVTVMGFVVFFLIYRNRVLKDLYARNVELMNNFGTEIHELEVTSSPDDASDEPQNLKSVFERLLISLKDEKIFMDPELSLSKICEAIKSNEKYVSTAIANYANTNFNNFVNSFRINEAKRLIYETNNLNLNEVMYASGFNSRTTFYTAFKKHTGMSPKQFKEMS